MTDKKEDIPKTNVDEELSNLLDSALEDFTKIESNQKDAKTDNSSKEVSTSNSANVEGQEWSNDFIQQAANQFEENFANFLAGADPNTEVTPEFIQQKLQQMAGKYNSILSSLC